MNNLTVLKIGGSFFNKQNLHKLRQIIEAIKNADNHQFIIVTGGGKAADLVRDYDSQMQLKAASSHFAAVAAMELNAYLISDYFNDFSFFTVDINFTKKINIFLPLAYYRKFDPLPHSWDVSSDSIALELSQRLKLSNLFLLKQRIIENKIKISSQIAANDNLLDNYFPILYQQSNNNLKSLIVDLTKVNNLEILIEMNKRELLNTDYVLKANNFNLLVEV